MFFNSFIIFEDVQRRSKKATQMPQYRIILSRLFTDHEEIENKIQIEDNKTQRSIL